MNNWCFESIDNWFSLTLPENWSEYDDGDKQNTVTFFNQNGWSGNLRITSFYNKNEEIQTDKAGEYIQSELDENPTATLIKIGEWDAAFYNREIDEQSLIYYWVTGVKNHLFMCSFTFDKSFLGTEMHNQELVIVADIIKSIKLLD